MITENFPKGVTQGFFAHVSLANMKSEAYTWFRRNGRYLCWIQ